MRNLLAGAASLILIAGACLPALSGESAPQNDLDSLIDRMCRGEDDEKNAAKVEAQGAAAIPVLLGRARADTGHTRAMCALSLGRIGGKEAAGALCELAADKKELSSILSAIAETKSETAVPAVRKLLQEGLPVAEREWTIIALGSCGDRDSIPELIRLLRVDRLPGLRKEAGAVLTRIAGRDFRGDAGQAAAWYEKETGNKVDVSLAPVLKRVAHSASFKERAGKLDLAWVSVTQNDYWLALSFETREIPDASFDRCRLVVETNRARAGNLGKYVITQLRLKPFARVMVEELAPGAHDVAFLSVQGQCRVGQGNGRTTIVLVNREGGAERIPLEAEHVFKLYDSNNNVIDTVTIQPGKAEESRGAKALQASLNDLPRTDHPWSANEHKLAAAVVVSAAARNPGLLPRHSEGEGGAVFRHLCLDGGLGEVEAKGLSQEGRSRALLQYHASIQRLLALYLAAGRNGENVDTEMAELSFCALRLVSKEAEEFGTPTAGEQPPVAKARAQALAEARTVLADTIKTTLLAASSKSQNADAVRLRLAQGLAALLPDAAKHLTVEDLKSCAALAAEASKGEPDPEIGKALQAVSAHLQDAEKRAAPAGTP